MRLRRYTSYRWQEKFPRVLLFSEKNPLDLRNFVLVLYIKQRFDSQTHMLMKTKEQKIDKIMKNNAKD